MRVLAIRGRNLASLAGDFAVELAAPPLADAGLFAITGPTGAGKSTLLDALCLALFDRVPRLPGSAGEVVGRADDDTRIAANDPRNLLRRGSAAGHAEVEFRGVDGRRYRARWEVRRARNRAEGRLQAQTLGLVDLENGQALGGTKTETLAAIGARLGLTFDQFRRSVLLAQGEFAAFLKAREADRADLLERITGTEVYSRVSQHAYQRARQERAALDELARHLELVQPLPEAQRHALEAERDQAADRRAALTTAAKQAEHALAWYERRRELATLMEQARHAHGEAELALALAADRRAHLAAVERAQPLRGLVDRFDGALAATRAAEAALVEARARHAQAATAAREQVTAAEAALRALEQAKAAIEEARPDLVAARHLDGELAAARERVAESARELAEAQTKEQEQARAVAALEERAEALARDHLRLHTWIEAHTGLKPLAQQWDRWQVEIDRHRDALAEECQAVAEGEAARAALEQLAARERELAEEFAKTHAEVEHLEGELRALAAGYDNTTLARAVAAWEQARDLKERWQTLARLTAGLKSETARRDQSAATLADCLARADAAEESHAAAVVAVDRLTGAAGEARHARDRLRLAHAADVEALRAGLDDDTPCPVCGATHHPYVHDSGGRLFQLLNDAEARVRAAEAELAAAGERRAQLLAENKARKAEATQLRKTLAEQERQAAAALAEWRRAAADLPGAPAEPLLPGVDAAIAARLGTAAERLDAAGSERQALLERQARQEQTRAALDAARARHDGRRGERDQIRDELARCRVAQQQAEHARTRAHAQQQRLEAALAAPLAFFENWRERLHRDAESFVRECQARAGEWRERQEALARTTREQEGGRATLEQMQRAYTDLRAALAERAARHGARQSEQGKVESQRRAYWGGRPAVEVEHELEARRAAAEEAWRRAADGRRGADTQLARAEESLHGQRQALADAERTFAQAREDLERELGAAGLDLESLRRDLCHSGDWLVNERHTLQRLHDDLHVARSVLEERRRALEAHEAGGHPGLSAAEAGPQREQAEQRLRQAEEALSELLAHLRADDGRRSDSARLRAQHDAQEAQWRRWQALSDLIGAADGKKFRTFAQGLTLDLLLAHANAHLATLRPRYRLERVPGSNLEMQIVDRDMGDEVRSVHSLSGGETFLASLALALALATLASDRTQVESLFIDEGFGSLDAETLDVAIDALEQLQSIGRTVGVISHVPALVERIGAQVRVIAEGGGRSRVEAVGMLNCEY